MNIILDQYGLHLSVQNEMFVIKDTANNERKISIWKVQNFLIYKTATVTTAAIVLATKNNIGIIIHEYNQPMVRCVSSMQGQHATIRKKQALYSTFDGRVAYMQQTMILKYKAQQKNLAYCANRLPSNKNLMLKKQKFDSLVNELTEATTITNLRSQEALLSKYYWYCIGLASKNYMPFLKRSKQPAQDLFNALLNYGYAILYAKVETAILAAGLDPQLGLMHADSFATPSLVYDIIEPFRGWVDEVILELMFTHKLNTEDFTKDAQGIRIGKANKQIFIEALEQHFIRSVVFNSKKIKRIDQIQYYCTQLAQFLLKQYIHV
jgi:CRISP-associated protein Cas1